MKRGKLSKRNSADRMLVLDVRDATEYKLGHPEGAFHFPYPRIYLGCVNDARPDDGGGCSEGTVSAVTQDPEDLYLMVEDKFRHGDQRMATLCRTGFRRVLAANLLSNPEQVICGSKYAADPDEDAACQAEYAGRGYTRGSNTEPQV